MRALCFGLALFFTMTSSTTIFVLPVAAQSLSDIFERTTYPVNYDQPRQIGRSRKRAESIDACLQRKEFFFNELHNVWVVGLERCKLNSKGILSKANFDGVSTEPEDEQLCFNKREGEILVNGTPSEEEARRWSERCSYLGTVGGAGPIGTGTTDNNFSRYYGGTSSSGTSTAATSSSTDSTTPATISSKTGFTPVYTGPGVQVPSEELIPKGISRKKNLSDLIVFYTNATLPYVSVISVFVFVAAGIYYILSFASDDLHTKAKTMMLYVVIGIIIIFSAYTLVNTLLRFATFQ